MLSIDDALAAIRQLIEKTHQAGEFIDKVIILVGGTALAAHGVRDLSHDVDLFVKTFSEDIVFQLENELKPVYGETFRLDVTATENLWGFILVRDIEENSPTFKTIDIDKQVFNIKVLSVETLFLLKLSADRQKDRDDLPLLAAKTTPDALIERFNAISKWHGNPQALIGYADEFVRQMMILYTMPASDVMQKLLLPRFIKDMLWESYYPGDTPENSSSSLY
jgi:predicted nucleotidyltransferase